MQRKLFPVILLWFIISLIIAGLSELHPDEAYYWMYSKFLDWGYFDHPPMVAIMTAAGYALFSNELGVRIMVVFLVSLVLWIIPQFNKSIFPTNSWNYGLIIFSIVCIAVLGFTNTPDGYLLFFTALYLLIYKAYLDGKDSWGNVFLWGFVMSCMLYSKYHGILVIGFTVLSNPKLLTQKKFWMAGVFGAILFIPHLWWQYSNDFPSIQYHLVDRSRSSYSLKYTTEYILGQLFYFGPLVGFLFYYYLYKSIAVNQFEKTLKTIAYGFLIFFLIMTFQGRIEANWTVVIVIPFIYFTLKFLHENPGHLKTFRYVAIPGILILLIARIQIVYPIIHIPGDRTNEMRGHRSLTEEVFAKAGKKPVAANTYQNASLLSFYSKVNVTSLNVSSRKNQFDFWDLDKQLYGKEIFFLNNHLKTGQEIVNARGQILFGTPINDPSFLRGVFVKIEELHLEGSEINVQFSIDIKQKYASIYGKSASFLELALRDERGYYSTINKLPLIPENILDNQEFFISGKIEEQDLSSGKLVVLLRTPGLGIWTISPLKID